MNIFQSSSFLVLYQLSVVLIAPSFLKYSLLSPFVMYHAHLFSSFQFATSSLFLVLFFLSNFKCLHFSRVGSKCFSPLNLYSFSKQYHTHQMLPSSTILVAQMVKRLSTMWETWVRSLGWEVPWRRKWQPTPVLLPRKSHGWRSLVSMGSQRVRHD